MAFRLSQVVVTALCCGLICGCPSSDDDYREFGEEDNVTNVTPPEEHQHAHGPNGGHLIELGEEEYHAEIVMDPDARTLTVYVLGSDAATPRSIGESSVTVSLKIGDETESLTLSADPQEGEADGQSSRFQLADATIPESIQDEEDLHGTVTVMVEGKEFVGEITHDHGHDDGHDHDH